jgi:FdhE protein
MSETPQFPELSIGKAAEDGYFRPPRLPDLFRTRGERLRHLSADHPLQDFLHLIAALADLQVTLVTEAGAPSPSLVSPEHAKTALEHKMPLLDVPSWRPTAWYWAALRRIARELPLSGLPEESRTTAQRLAEASDDALNALGIAVVTRTVSSAAAGEAVFAVAALQAEFAQYAAALDPRMVRPLEANGLCPACGSPPVAGVVVADEAYGRRYLTCSLCCSSWNHVRVNCIVCGDEKKVAYQEIEGASGEVKAETCDACGSYSKLLYAAKDAYVEPFADDLASFGLDLLVSETGWKRHAPNPFLQGH